MNQSIPIGTIYWIFTMCHASSSHLIPIITLFRCAKRVSEVESLPWSHTKCDLNQSLTYPNASSLSIWKRWKDKTMAPDHALEPRQMLLFEWIKPYAICWIIYIKRLNFPLHLILWGHNPRNLWSRATHIIHIYWAPTLCQTVPFAEPWKGRLLSWFALSIWLGQCFWVRR